MRQNTDAMRVSFIQSSLDSWNSHAMTMAASEQLTNAFFDGAYPELKEKFGSTETSDGQIAMWFTATLRTVETLYLQWQAGNLPDEVWHGYRASLVRSFASNQSFANQWTSMGDVFAPSFKAYGDALNIEGAEVRARLLSADGSSG